MLYSVQEALHCYRTISFYLASSEYLLFIMVVSLCLILFAGGIVLYRTLRSHLASCSIIKLLRLLLCLVLFAWKYCFGKLHQYCDYQSERVKEKLYFLWGGYLPDGQMWFSEPRPLKYIFSSPPLYCQSTWPHTPRLRGTAHAHLFFYIVVSRPRPHNKCTSIAHINLQGEIQGKK